MRYPSTALSLSAAASTGSTPSDSLTNIASANGTRTRSLTAPPYSVPESGESPNAASFGTPVQNAPWFFFAARALAAADLERDGYSVAPFE